MRNPALEPKNCAVKECGASVYVLPVQSGDVVVDPKPVEVVVQDSKGRFRLVKGFRPHRSTCVDITARWSGD